jgi:hypothetical protein
MSRVTVSAVEVSETACVGLDSYGIRSEFGDSSVKLRLAPASNVNESAFAQEGLRGAEPDALTAAGDKCCCPGACRE